MNFYVEDDQPLRRGEVLSAFRSALSSVLGRTVKTRDARFLDSSLADFMAWDAAGRVYAIRWIDGREIASKLFDLLSEYARLAEAGGPALERALETGDTHPDGTVELILVGHRFSDRFVDVLSTLAIPVRLVSVHSVRSGERAEKALYFETRFSKTQNASHGSADLPEPEFEDAASSDSIQELPDVDRQAVRPLPLDGRHPDGAEVLPAQNAKISSIGMVSGEADEYEDLVSPASDSEDDDDGAFGELSPEESTHFRLLEAALGPRES